MRIEKAKNSSRAKNRIAVQTETSERETSRMNFRLAPEVKARVVQAANLAGQDLTEFAVATLSQKADEVIERHSNLILSSDDYKFFLAALEAEDAAEPSATARAAAAKYRLGKRKGVRYHVAD